jgi:hypothetical protein
MTLIDNQKVKTMEKIVYIVEVKVGFSSLKDDLKQDIYSYFVDLPPGQSAKAKRVAEIQALEQFGMATDVSAVNVIRARTTEEEWNKQLDVSHT